MEPAPPNLAMEGPLVTSAFQPWIIHSNSLAFRLGQFMNRPYNVGGTCLWSRLSEGLACHVCFAMLDYPLLFTGHDKRAPPKDFPEGPACQVR